MLAAIIVVGLVVYAFKYKDDKFTRNLCLVSAVMTFFAFLVEAAKKYELGAPLVIIFSFGAVLCFFAMIVILYSKANTKK